MHETHQPDGSMSDHSHQGLGSQIHAYFTPLGGVALDLPGRTYFTQDLQRRTRIVEMFLQGEWGVDLEIFKADHEQERLRESDDG